MLWVGYETSVWKCPTKAENVCVKLGVERVRDRFGNNFNRVIRLLKSVIRNNK